MTVIVEPWQAIAALVAYTGGIIGIAAWLNTKLNSLLPTETFERRWCELERRLRALELWAAAKNGPPDGRPVRLIDKS
jgi:hypothetical protein